MMSLMLGSRSLYFVDNQYSRMASSYLRQDTRLLIYYNTIGDMKRIKRTGHNTGVQLGPKQAAQSNFDGKLSRGCETPDWKILENSK